MRNAKADLKMVRDCSCVADFSEFATEALPYWINRAITAERDRDIWAKTAREHQKDIEKYWDKKVRELEREIEKLKVEKGE